MKLLVAGIATGLALSYWVFPKWAANRIVHWAERYAATNTNHPTGETEL